MSELRPAVAGTAFAEWQQFGAAHLIAIAMTTACCAAVWYFRGELRRCRLDRYLAAAMLALDVAWIVYCLVTGYKDWGFLLPLYTCDGVIILGVIWALWKRRWVGEVLFVWAALGGVVTVLMPDTDGYGFSHFVADQTMLGHALMLLLAVEMVVVERFQPSWRAVVSTSLATFILIPPSLWANHRFGADYMFVSKSPGGVFSFLNAFEGAGRVWVTIGTGAVLLAVSVAVWFAVEQVIRRFDTTPVEASAPRM